MRLTAAFLAHELRIQRRSLRFRAFAVGYLILGCLPAAVIHLRREHIDYAVGGASYAVETLIPLPLLTALLAGLLALDGINRERRGGAWTTATLTGVSNAGYLVRRWLALLAVVLPLTAVPPLFAAGVALADTGGPLVPAVFFGPWLLHVVPVAAALSALALGLGTIAGNAASTFVLVLLVFGVVPAVGNDVLDHFRLRFSPPLGWLDIQPAAFTARRLRMGNDPKTPWGRIFPLTATESGFDLGTEAEQDLAEGLLLATAAAAALGIAVVFLRRTRPDVRPQRIRPDHPLRNFLVTFGRLREQYTPDPAPAPTDLAAVGLALLAAAGGVALLAGRAVHFEHRAEVRWQAETQAAIAPMAQELAPESWRIEGGLDGSGTLALRVSGSLRNTGRQPQGHLAFTLAPDLELEVSADRGRAAVRRSWDRLAIELDPPIEPGGRRELRFRLAGRPGETYFGQPTSNSGDDLSFWAAYKRHREARFSHDRSDLSRWYEVPAVNGYRVALNAPCLTPVPRYTPWALDRGSVPAELYTPLAQVDLALAVPRDLLVADSCGGLSDPAGTAGKPGRLDSRCTLPVSDLAVMGGRQRLLPGTRGGGAAVAVFPAHRTSGTLHLGFLQGGTRLLDEAWPGMGGLDRMVLLEWPDEQVHRRDRMSALYRWRDPFDDWVTVTGNLVFLRESDLIGTQPLPPEPMVAEIIATRLARRRRLDPGQSLFFRQLLRRIVLQRLGLGSETGAVVGPLDRQFLPSIYEPALHPEHYNYWNLRFPSLVAALTRRAGAEPLRASLDELLAPGGDHAQRPATFDEFAAILKRRAERPVDAMIRDFFLAGDLPELVLDGVAFQSSTGGWRATGKVRNEGKGEAVCRLVLATDLGPVETEVRTGSGETVGFTLSSPHRPQGVFLDPDHECHRLIGPGAPRDRVYFQGGNR